MAAEQQDVEALKRRGRRRLVGAVALVLLAVIVLPMVFDPAPRGTAPSVSVRIPGENETPFAPKPPPKKPEAAKAEQAKAEPAKAEAAKAQRKAPAVAAEEFIVQVGVFANPKSALTKLQSAKVPHYTEVMQGNLTRVRAGPYASRQAAEKALEQLKGLGFRPGAVAPKAG